jgi:hypothetical protein
MTPLHRRTASLIAIPATLISGQIALVAATAPEQAQEGPGCPGEPMAVQATGVYQNRPVPEIVINGQPWGGAYWEEGMRSYWHCHTAGQLLVVWEGEARRSAASGCALFGPVRATSRVPERSTGTARRSTRPRSTCKCRPRPPARSGWKRSAIRTTAETASGWRHGPNSSARGCGSSRQASEAHQLLPARAVLTRVHADGDPLGVIDLDPRLLAASKPVIATYG